MFAVISHATGWYRYGFGQKDKRRSGNKLSAIDEGREKKG
jgi:hypothetical protein